MCDAKKSVLLGMSGGTDSSVAAMLLRDAGYEVTGVTFRFYEVDDNRQYLDDAAELCRKLDIPHLVYDARERFRAEIVDYFIREYMDARTPVPCVLCNNRLKWPLLASIADERNIDLIATGHYVQKVRKDGNWHIRCAVDEDKDQSFFLWGLSQQLLDRMILPMGNITKKYARELAAKRGFRKVSVKRDSLGVCFCPFDYRTFLRRYIDNDQIKQGRYIDESGKFLGWHEGYPFYTIGQRRGLGIHLNKAVFVKDIDRQKNLITLAPLKSLEKQEMYLTDWNIINEKLLLNRDDITVRIRYRKQENRCTVSKTENGQLHVQLHEPLAAIAPGQAAAFYDGDLVLGGGIIV